MYTIGVTCVHLILKLNVHRITFFKIKRLEMYKFFLKNCILVKKILMHLEV
jgi:hypothetical protein